jgi:flagellar hook-associated protein 2
LRFTSSYAKKSTKVSDSTKATIVAGDNAVNGTQTLEIKETAKSGYLTGAIIQGENGEKLTSTSKLSDIDSSLTGKTISLTVGIGDDAKTTDVEITSDMTISDFVSKLQDAGVNASFDEKNQRFFISSTATGKANGFTLTAKDADGNMEDGNLENGALIALGLYSGDDNTNDKTDYNTYDKYGNGSQATMVKAQDAEIILNGATFTSDTNTFTINGLTITANAKTDADEVLSITTETDYEGIYDSIKDFISEYNEVINKMYKLYNADSARKYSMLTDDEKEEMTDDEVEAWEDKIKDALLRKDTTVYSVMSTMRNATTQAYTVNGTKMYLSDFGIGTLSYFEADENERYALHIDGDEDDESTSTNTDKLMSALATDPDGTIEFFSSMCKNMYDSLYETMRSTDYSSIYKVYDDKRLQTEYDDYTTQISDAEDELSDYEDYWYSKFSSMETALANLTSTQSVVSSMLGTS